MKLYVEEVGVDLSDNKIYRICCGDRMIGDWVHSEDLADGQSSFVPRYSFNGTALVDNYDGMTDEEVAEALQAAEAADAAAKAAALASA